MFPFRLSIYRPSVNQAAVFHSKRSANSAETNSAIEVYFQGGSSINSTPWCKEAAITKVLEALLEEPCFDTLRTKEQLGYSVSCSYRLTCGICGFLFEIKSATHTAEHLDSRVESFVNCAATYLRKLPRAEFESRRDELCKDILEPPSSLDEAADELWGGVTRRDGVFDGTPTLQANAVRTVSKEDVIHWWDMHVMSETQSRTSFLCGLRPQSLQMMRVAALDSIVQANHLACTVREQRRCLIGGRQ